MVGALTLQRGLCLNAVPCKLEGLISIREGGLIEDCGEVTFGGAKSTEGGQGELGRRLRSAKLTSRKGAKVAKSADPDGAE